MPPKGSIRAGSGDSAKTPTKSLDIEKESAEDEVLSSLVRSYVEAIRNGAAPCIETALITMAKQENGKAIEEALKLYSQTMDKSVELPTNNDDELFNNHHQAVNEAVDFFTKKAVCDQDASFQRKLYEELDVMYTKWKKRNDDTSAKKTQELLDNLNKPIAKKWEKGEYQCNGGYAIYQTDLHYLQTEFESAKGLGVKAKDTFSEFLSKNYSRGASILEADKKVTAEEKKAEAKLQEINEAQRQQEMAKREADLKAKHDQDMKRVTDEITKKLEKKREEEMANMKKHYDEVVARRLEEQERTLKEGFGREVLELRNEMLELKLSYEKKNQSWSEWASEKASSWLNW